MSEWEELDAMGFVALRKWTANMADSYGFEISGRNIKALAGRMQSTVTQILYGSSEWSDPTPEAAFRRLAAQGRLA